MKAYAVVDPQNAKLLVAFGIICRAINLLPAGKYHDSLGIPHGNVSWVSRHRMYQLSLLTLRLAGECLRRCVRLRWVGGLRAGRHPRLRKGGGFCP